MTTSAASPAEDDESVLALIERYYDEVPRAWATVHDLGPFTLFVRTSEQGWPFYARPRLGWLGTVTPDDVRQVQQLQRELGAPESFEWVAETSPTVAAAVREAGLEVHDHPLMVLRSHLAAPELPTGVRVEVIDADHPDLAAVWAAIGAAFGETDELGPPGPTEDLRARLASGLLRLVGAFDGSDPVGGGSHSPRGAVTEVAGIGVLPRAQRRGIGAAVTAALVDDARALDVTTVFLSAGDQRVADLYARVGFVRVATACIAEAGG